MLRSRGDQGDELEPLNPRHPDSLAASPSRTPTPSPASKRPRPSPLHGVSGGANGDQPPGAAAILPEYLEGMRLEAGGAQPRPLPLWQLLLAGGLLLTVALVAVDYEMEVCVPAYIFAVIAAPHTRRAFDNHFNRACHPSCVLGGSQEEEVPTRCVIRVLQHGCATVAHNDQLLPITYSWQTATHTRPLLQVSLSQAKGYQGHAAVRRAIGSAVGTGLQRPLRDATAGRAAGGRFKSRGTPAISKGLHAAQR